MPTRHPCRLTHKERIAVKAFIGQHYGEPVEQIVADWNKKGLCQINVAYVNSILKWDYRHMPTPEEIEILKLEIFAKGYCPEGLDAVKDITIEVQKR